MATLANATVSMEVPAGMRSTIEAMMRYLAEVAGREANSRDLCAEERGLQDHLHALGRAGMELLLASADTRGAEVEIDGALWGNQRRTRGEYFTLFGSISLDRSTYQTPSRGRVAVPLELRLGMFEGRYTPALARVMAMAVGMMPESDAETFLREVGVAKVSVSTLHRLPRKIAARYETRREVIDRALREQDHVPVAAVVVQASLDGVMVPQDGEHTQARGRVPKAGLAAPPRHEIRYGPVGPEAPASSDDLGGRPWHEAAVGALHYSNELGQPSGTTYLARMPESRKVTLIGQLEAELTSALDERPDLDVVLASDGALLHWHALELMAERLRPRITGRLMLVLDFYHAAQYLTKAATIIWGTDAPEARIHAATWRETLKARSDGAANVLGSIRYYRDQLPNGSDREKLQAVIDFLAGNHAKGRMEYSLLESHFLPIGTGVIEAAAKTLVNVRMKRAGSRFSQHGGQAVLLFRTASACDRFEPLMNELHLSYAKRVAELKPLAA